MRSVSPSHELGRPDGFDAGIAQSATWDRAREWLGGGRFWSAVLVLLLTLTVARSTATVHWVEGIDVITPIAIVAAVLMSILALLPIRERIRARDAGIDAGAAAVDQLHGLDCQCNAGQGQAHGRRAVGLLGERPRGDGRAYRPGHHAAPAVHRRQNARPGVGSLHELGAASAAPQQSRHFPDRRRTRRDRLQ